jgi:hypothetical protein
LLPQRDEGDAQVGQLVERDDKVPSRARASAPSFKSWSKSAETPARAITPKEALGMKLRERGVPDERRALPPCSPSYDQGVAERYGWNGARDDGREVSAQTA